MKTPTFEEWNRSYGRRLHGWLMDCGVGGTAEVVTLLPDLVALLLHLGADARLPDALRPPLHAEAERIMQGMELLPDDWTGVMALTQDARKVARLLQPLLPRIPAAALADHWQHPSLSLEAVVEGLLGDAAAFAAMCSSAASPSGD